MKYLTSLPIGLVSTCILISTATAASFTISDPSGYLPLKSGETIQISLNNKLKKPLHNLQYAQYPLNGTIQSFPSKKQRLKDINTQLAHWAAIEIPFINSRTAGQMFTPIWYVVVQDAGLRTCQTAPFIITGPNQGTGIDPKANLTLKMTGKNSCEILTHKYKLNPEHKKSEMN